MRFVSIYGFHAVLLCQLGIHSIEKDEQQNHFKSMSGIILFCLRYQNVNDTGVETTGMHTISSLKSCYYIKFHSSMHSSLCASLDPSGCIWKACNSIARSFRIAIASFFDLRNGDRLNSIANRLKILFFFLWDVIGALMFRHLFYASEFPSPGYIYL